MAALLAIGGLVPGAVGAEEFTPVRVFRNFTRGNPRGLPQSTVRTMVQDPQGVLWIGTLDGLAAYDGVEMAEVLPPAGLPAFGTINSLALRRRGGLYVGGSAGVHAFDGRAWRLLAFPTMVVSVAEQADGRIWVVEQSGALHRSRGLPEEGRGWDEFDGLALPGPYTKVTVATDGAVWVVARTGVFRLAGDRPGVMPALPEKSGNVTGMMVARDGTCWIGTQAGLVWCARIGDAAWRAGMGGPRPPGNVAGFAEDAQGRIWAGTFTGYVSHARPGGEWQTWGPVEGLNPEAGVLSVLADREGSLWFGQNAGGVQQLVTEDWQHRNRWETPRRSLPSGGVFGVSGGADGRVFAAVFNRGLWVWDGERTRQYGAEEGLTENVRTAAEPEPGRIWVGARGGIWESRNGGNFTKVFATRGGFVTGFFKSPAGVWHAATSASGILVHGPGGWAVAAALNERLPDSQVRALAWLSDDELWVASNSGVTILRPDRAVVLTPQEVPALPAPANAVLAVGPGEVWVGGLGGLAVRRGGQWTRWTVADGLPGRTIYSLARAADGAVWAGGSQGVGRHDAAGWRIFDSRNGLLDEECNTGGLHLAEDGSVYVGTMGGLARYRAESREAAAPGLQVHWRQRPEPDGTGVARLSAEHRALHLAWAAPWLQPVGVEYRTRVRPLSESWSEPSERRELHVENLGPGRWTVEVQARLKGGGEAAWTPPLATAVEIAPYFHETIWARLLAVAGLVAGGVGVARLWTWRLRRRQRELQAAVAEAQASVKTLRGLIPICASCKNIRDDRGSWNQLEAYVHAHSEAEFSHGICPECVKRLYPDLGL